MSEITARLDMGPRSHSLSLWEALHTSFPILEACCALDESMNIFDHRNSHFQRLSRVTRQAEYTIRELLIKAQLSTVDLDGSNRRFKFQKRRQLFLCTHNETLSIVTMRVRNKNCSPG